MHYHFKLICCKICPQLLNICSYQEQETHLHSFSYNQLLRTVPGPEALLNESVISPTQPLASYFHEPTHNSLIAQTVNLSSLSFYSQNSQLAPESWDKVSSVSLSHTSVPVLSSSLNHIRSQLRFPSSDSNSPTPNSANASTS